jgi:hypothetical protein
MQQVQRLQRREGVHVGGAELFQGGRLVGLEEDELGALGGLGMD